MRCCVFWRSARLSLSVYANSKDRQQFGCAWIIKVKMGESAGFQGALPASLIIHVRPVHLQTAGILTNLTHLPPPVTDSLCLCLLMRPSHISGFVCLYFASLCVCVWRVFFWCVYINDLYIRGEVEDVSGLPSNRLNLAFGWWCVEFP